MSAVAPERVAFFDVDGTLVSRNIWKGVVAYPGISRMSRYRFYTRALPGMLGYLSKRIPEDSFRDDFIRQMAGLFTGWSQAAVLDLFAWVVNGYMSGFYREDVVARLREHLENGDQVVLVSNMFQEGIQAFADYLGADTAIGTRLTYRDGICQGRVVGESCAGPRKVDFIHEYLTERRFAVQLADCYAYADSVSDQHLLGAVGQPTAVYPDAGLRTLAQERGWAILPMPAS
ncbi:MAG: HAD-IB family hydrolase [Anaerolineaceae bacterium]|nr:HAD-IB family hydrolase [Anaerolineaceae bacterium]